MSRSTVGSTSRSRRSRETRPGPAAADESLRPDLLTLLAETDDRGLFDSDRLRAELGLSQP